VKEEGVATDHVWMLYRIDFFGGGERHLARQRLRLGHGMEAV
jgi:hypothetical protein